MSSNYCNNKNQIWKKKLAIYNNATTSNDMAACFFFFFYHSTFVDTVSASWHGRNPSNFCIILVRSQILSSSSSFFLFHTFRVEMAIQPIVVGVRLDPNRWFYFYFLFYPNDRWGKNNILSSHFQTRLNLALLIIISLNEGIIALV